MMYSDKYHSDKVTGAASGYFRRPVVKVSEINKSPQPSSQDIDCPSGYCAEPRRDQDSLIVGRPGPRSLPPSEDQKRKDAVKIGTRWMEYSHKPSVSEVRLAAQLACEGHLTSVERMRLENLDISDIPGFQLTKLASIVTDYVRIEDVARTSQQLSSILTNVRGQARVTELVMGGNLALGEIETRSLVNAMRFGVEFVILKDMLSLDMETLYQYNWRGRCWGIRVEGNTMRRYKDRFKWWSDRGGRTICEHDGGACLTVTRLEEVYRPIKDQGSV